MKYFFYYLLTVNALACLLMLIDKKKAVKHQWRIPEATLMTFAFLGGSVGILIGMETFRHKTRKLKFSLGVPLILIGQICIAALVLVYMI